MATLILEKPLSELLSEIKFRTTYSASDVEEVSIPLLSLTSALSDVNARLKIKLRKGKCSELFKKQLAIHKLQLGEKYGEFIHFYHYQTILDTIEANENGHPVNNRPFTRNPDMRDFQHIHHNSTQFIKENVLNLWNRKKKGKDEIIFQNHLLNEIYLELLKTHTEEIARQSSLKVLLNKLHDESVFKEFQDKTGEWIICVCENERWYYLCLATHKEGDENIVERVRRAVNEFPELGKI